MVAAFTKSLEVFACGPYAGSGHVRSALVDGADLEPHTRCDHLWDELQLGKHLEPRDAVPRHTAAPPPVPEKQEAAVDSQLDVVVVVGASQGAPYCTEERGPGAFGESPNYKCQSVSVVVAQACTQRCAVGVPCLGHCDGDLGWRWGVCRGWGGGGYCASGRGGQATLLLQELEQSGSPVDLRLARGCGCALGAVGGACAGWGQGYWAQCH